MDDKIYFESSIGIDSNEDQSNNSYPDLCRSCNKFSKQTIVQSCSLCTKLGFFEWILCELNQSVQSGNKDFICRAYQPALKLAGEPTEKPDIPRPLHSDEILRHAQQSIKYKSAIAKQRLGRDPDSVSVTCKFHLVWSTRYRTKDFSDGSFNDAITSAFYSCGDKIGGTADLLLVAEDHVHVFLRTDGEVALNTIVGVLKEESMKTIKAQFKNMSHDIWDDSYFSETMM
ncbi:MAG: IS200/IS605 family transposase [Oligoflexales bacterium]